MADDHIRIVPADPGRPAQFEAERDRLQQALAGERVGDIVHFGSTAVPGLAAKPIIDILIAVPSVAVARERFPDLLRPLDYVFWAENPRTDRLFFVKGMPPYGTGRTHHVHVRERPAGDWDEVHFRDFLRAHPSAAADYAALKQQLAETHASDREAYTDAKAAFVAGVLKRAAAEG
ncbi:MAG: GrpB family protein [Pacificimonas sp.]|jgi:GrpB-like predicted nucleotidyltransferase (UPF0157 family)|nr:GrpB family protein [Pacificimonas sp.]